MNEEDLKLIEETVWYIDRYGDYEHNGAPDRLVEAYRGLQKENDELNREAAGLRLKVANNTSDALVDVHKQLDKANEYNEAMKLDLMAKINEIAALKAKPSKTGFDTYVEDRLKDPVFAAEFQAAKKQIKTEPVNVTIVQESPPNEAVLSYIKALQKEIKRLQREVLRAQKSEWHHQDQVWEIEALLGGHKDPSVNGCSFYCKAIGDTRALVMNYKEAKDRLRRAAALLHILTDENIEPITLGQWYDQIKALLEEIDDPYKLLP